MKAASKSYDFFGITNTSGAGHINPWLNTYNFLHWKSAIGESSIFFDDLYRVSVCFGRNHKVADDYRRAFKHDYQRHSATVLLSLSGT